MRQSGFRYYVLCGCLTALLTGCSAPVSPTPATASGTTTSPATPPPPARPSYSVGVSLTHPSVIVGTNGWGPTLVYDPTQSGSSPYASLEGCLPAVDGQGNVYLLTFQYPYGCGDSPASIEVYAHSAVGGGGIRSLSVGAGSKIASVQGMAVSPSGEIFVNDGNGVSVFSATASGSDSPARYVQWASEGGSAPVAPGFIAVDSADNLYVQNGLSIGVFRPQATGLVLPSRVISGPQTQLNAPGRMTTDAQRNLYVMVGTSNPAGVGLVEFAPDASGDVAPARTLSSKGLENWSGFPGVAVDASGLIYISATDPYCGAVFVFAADASGSANPFEVLGGSCPAYDIDGTIAVF